MKSIIAIAATAAALIATPAAAQVYLNAGYSQFTSDDEDIDVSLGAITGRVGTKFMPNFGAELEGSIGVADDSVTVMGVPVDVELKHSVGAYLVGFLPVSEDFELLGRVGVSSAEIEASAAGFSISEDGSGFEVGVGGQYFFGGGNHGVRADYTYSDSVSSHVFSIAYAVRFGGE